MQDLLQTFRQSPGHQKLWRSSEVRALLGKLAFIMLIRIVIIGMIILRIVIVIMEKKWKLLLPNFLFQRLRVKTIPAEAPAGWMQKA